MAANANVAEHCLRVVGEPNDWTHCVGAPEEHAEVLAGLVGLHQHEGVHSVGALSALAVVVVAGSGTCRPHSVGTFAELELLVSFAETVNSLGGQHEVHLDEFVHHHEGLVEGVDEHGGGVGDVVEGE